jgi:hypothetical protein
VTLWWGSIGALLGFGIAGLASIGVFLLPVALVLLVVAVLVPALRSPATPGLLIGLSAAPLFIAWLNRDGPGLVCTRSGTTTTCVDEWSPWPFVATGVLLAVGGLGLLVHGRRVDARAVPAAGELSTDAADTAGPAART